MDFLTFSVEIMKAVAWPVVTLIALIMLKSNFESAVQSLRALKYKDFEFEFTELREIGDELNNRLSNTNALLLDNGGYIQRYSELAKISPRAAIIEAWRDVESAALECARNNIDHLRPRLNEFGKHRNSAMSDGVIKPDDSFSDFDLIRAFQVSSLMPDEMKRFFSMLKGIRNKATRVDEKEMDVDVDVAVEYGISAYRMVRYIRNITESSENK